MIANGPGGPGGSLGGGSSGVKRITKSKKKFDFYIIHIILDKINVNLIELSLDLVNFVGSADALQGGRGYYHALPIGDPWLRLPKLRPYRLRPPLG